MQPLELAQRRVPPHAIQRPSQQNQSDICVVRAQLLVHNAKKQLYKMPLQNQKVFAGV